MTGHRPTYPGIIPYRTSSPSSPTLENDSRLPELIKVSQNNFSLRRNPSTSASNHNIGGRHPSLSNLQFSNSPAYFKAASLERQKSVGADVHHGGGGEEELRDKFFEYWATQQVRLQDLF
jgi:hypothetical protein